MKNFKTTFQNIHYQRQKPNFCLGVVLSLGEFFYGAIINLKNFLYAKNILKEEKTPARVICIGNLTTGGVGKTPIVINLANKLSKSEKVAVISRGYGSKLQNKTPNIIKDFKEIKFKNGSLCGDEPFQCAKETSDNVIVITCANRKKAIEEAFVKYNCKTVILDDGFSNRKVKKDKTILVIDSKMRFGNNHLLPKGPLREPINEIKRADEIIIVNKGDDKVQQALDWAKKFNKKLYQCDMIPSKIYNIQTNAQIIPQKQKAIAFCAIGQSGQFFDFAKEFYDLKKEISYPDHYKYNKNDIKELVKTAKELKSNIFITTQKDESKLKPLIEDIKGYSFNVLKLDVSIEEVN